jgi:hypothetical protein
LVCLCVLVGRGSGLFSVQIHHGGYFLGHGNNRSYVGCGSVWLDNVDSDDWCPLFLENLVEDLGYEKQGRMTIYYCVPILSIDRNGLRLLEDQVDTDAMVNWVGCEKHFFNIYLDHDQSIRAIDWDDVVQFPVADLPPVISPMKPANNVDVEDATSQVDDIPVPLQTVQPEQERRTRSKKKMNLKSQSDDEDENREAQSDDDAGSDFALQDSDYDLSDDDDLYEDNVDDDEGKVKKTQVKENVKVEGDGDSEEEDLWAPDSDDDKVEMKLKTFRKEDLSNVSLHVGLKFADAAMVRAAIREYSCQNRREIILPINDRTRINGKCRGSDTCSWNIWVSYDNRTKCWMVKTYEPRHSCRKKWNVRAFTADFIARKFMESFKADQGMNLKNFQRLVQKDWNMTPSSSKLRGARRIAMRRIYGDEEAQYSMLWDFGNELRTTNPGSSFYLALDENARFRRCYMSLQASKVGFLEGCMPIIFLDDTHIKTRYIGQLLCAVGIDPNDCILPIAIAAVEVEDTENWTWFLETLKKDLDIVNTTPWTVMSDKQKVDSLLHNMWHNLVAVTYVYLSMCRV